MPVNYSRADFTISWEFSSYTFTESSGGSVVCAIGSGTLQNNLNLQLSAVTQDNTATGAQPIICTGNM